MSFAGDVGGVAQGARWRGPVLQRRRRPAHAVGRPVGGIGSIAQALAPLDPARRPASPNLSAAAAARSAEEPALSAAAEASWNAALMPVPAPLPSANTRLQRRTYLILRRQQHLQPQAHGITPCATVAALRPIDQLIQRHVAQIGEGDVKGADYALEAGVGDAVAKLVGGWAKKSVTVPARSARSNGSMAARSARTGMIGADARHQHHDGVNFHSQQSAQRNAADRRQPGGAGSVQIRPCCRPGAVWRG